MPCIHGIDETNCPICRITELTVPIKFPNLKNLYNNDLKPFNPHLEDFINDNKNFQKELIPRNDIKLAPKLINPILKPNLINQIPSFKNELFLERLREIDVIGISQKIEISSPELKIKKKE